MSVLVPLTGFKVTSPQILTLSSSPDYTFHIAADRWLIHIGALSQGKTARHSQGLIYFVPEQNSLFISVFWDSGENFLKTLLCGLLYGKIVLQT